MKIRKTRSTKKCVRKRKLPFKNYKNCLEATKFDKIGCLEKRKIYIENFLKSYEEYIRKNELI